MSKFRDGFTSTGASAGLIALVLTLSTGTAVAATRAIGSKDIKNHSITSVDLKAGAVTSATVQNESLGSADVKNGSLHGWDLAPSSLDGSRVRNHSLTGADIASNTLGQVPSAGNAITVNGVRETIATRNVTCPKAATVTTVKGDGWSIIETCTVGTNSGWVADLKLASSATYYSSHEQGLKADDNGGDPQAYNYNFASSYGDSVNLGDSDDLLRTVSTTVIAPDGHTAFIESASRHAPGASSTQYTLSIRQLA